ncbi:MAG: hypothetical protein HYW88_02930, partial [Candidatus Sungbacteria bacterium]|nr:hypothetical protein [Candidatus Sungbacteria bacterium]
MAGHSMHTIMRVMTLYQDLQNIGLSPNQAYVYLTLFQTQRARAGEIIKKTGFHRNLVYVALQELIKKKLVTSSNVHGVTVYKVLAPIRLLSDLQDKERIAKGVIEELSRSTGHNTQEIVVYEGIDEFRRHVSHTYSIVKSGALVRYLGISPQWHEIIGPPLEKDLAAIQKEKRFRMKGLAKSVSRQDREYMREVKNLIEVRTSPLISSDTSGIEILD